MARRWKTGVFALGGGALVLLAGYALGVAEPARLAWLTRVVREWRAPKAVSADPGSPFDYLPGEADVVMLGDSITASTQWAELLPGTKVINRGVHGDTVSGVAARLDEVLRRKPRMVFLMLGVNDVRAGRSNDAIGLEYGQIVRRLRAQGVETYVQSTLLVTASSAGAAAQNEAILSLNGRLRALCEGTGAHFVDLLPRLCPGGALDARFTMDGLHLNGPGYLIWADEVRKRLK